MTIYKATISKENNEDTFLYVSFNEEKETMKHIIFGLATKVNINQDKLSIKSIRKVNQSNNEILFVYLGYKSFIGKSSIEIYQMINKWRKENLLWFIEELTIELMGVKNITTKYHLFEQFS